MIFATESKSVWLKPYLMTSKLPALLQLRILIGSKMTDGSRAALQKLAGNGGNQFVELGRFDRFSQMMEKSRFAAQPDIVFHAETAHRNAAQPMPVA